MYTTCSTFCRRVVSAGRPAGVAMLLCLICFATASPAQADEVTIKGMLYSNVKVEDFDGHWITFRLQGGKQMYKSAEDLTKVKLDGEAALNAAEELAAKGKFDEAIAMYKQANALANEGWRQKLIQSRMKRALNLQRAARLAATTRATTEPTTRPTTKPETDNTGQTDQTSDELKPARRSALAFAKFLEQAPLHPRQRSDWRRSTALQRDAAQKSWERKHRKWVATLQTFIGEHVTWELVCDNIVPTEDNKSFVVSARWRRRLNEGERWTGGMVRQFQVRAVLPAKARGTLMRIGVGDNVELSGTVKAFRVSARRMPDWSEYYREPATIIMDLGPYVPRRLHPRIPGPKKKRVINYEKYLPSRSPFWVGLSECTIKWIKPKATDDKTPVRDNVRDNRRRIPGPRIRPEDFVPPRR